jgi:hypothetical protein
MSLWNITGRPLLCGNLRYNSIFKKSNKAPHLRVLYHLHGLKRYFFIYRLTFGTVVLHLIQINHQPEATIFQFIILTFVYSSTCFGRFPAHHQELNDCSGSLWFYLRIVVTVVMCSWSGRPAGRPDHEHITTVTMIQK